MVKKRAIDCTNAPAEQAVAPTPPPARCRIRLESMPAVEKELRRLYRDARSGAVPVADASRLANVLLILARIREVGTLEARLDALEAADHDRP
jgi:hypothetical protein